MQEITYINRFKTRKQSFARNQTSRTRYRAAILFGLIGGSLSAVAGFLLLGIYSLTGGVDALENYGGVALLVAAFIFFAVGAHFLDKSEEQTRLLKKLKFEKFKTSSFIEIEEIQ